ncbi:ABC transporter ATP-binding protein [Pseudooceanicola aestuarii]|uniref:ABC transporter ATP-binding protein n=1 Tax=Pseudooceanicola aestuarii TaxID=2697319 RepID=UPI0013CFC150|nr:ABC transporter ATP-binding protein [Pseudooceanicola aestuarii]
MTEPLLDIRDLRISFRAHGGQWAEALRGVDLSVEPGKVLGVVGESGSGKSIAMMAFLQLLPGGTRVTGSARFRGEDLIGMTPARIRRIRGKSIGCVFQDPLSAFNPVIPIGTQIAEAIRLHDRSVSRRAALKEAERLFEMVAIPQPARRVRQYPHEFSGGMRQRAMIAMALANRPDLLIADEPTTALDVTVQAQILDLLADLRRDLGIGMVLITHDLGVVAGIADEIAVMYGGRVVERGGTDAVFYDTAHPYTAGLIGAVPTLDGTSTLRQIEGTPPSIFDRPEGCSFHPRCDRAQPRCARQDPALRAEGATARACHFPLSPPHADPAPRSTPLPAET